MACQVGGRLQASVYRGYCRLVCRYVLCPMGTGHRSIPRRFHLRVCQHLQFWQFIESGNVFHVVIDCRDSVQAHLVHCDTDCMRLLHALLLPCGMTCGWLSEPICQLLFSMLRQLFVTREFMCVRCKWGRIVLTNKKNLQGCAICCNFAPVIETV